MEDVIKQIVQIDSVALNTKRDREETLRMRKEQYEKEIQEYRKTNLETAQQRADELYEQIVATGINKHQIEEEKCKQMTLMIEKQYLQVEEALLEEVFNELLGVEG